MTKLRTVSDTSCEIRCWELLLSYSLILDDMEFGGKKAKKIPLAGLGRTGEESWKAGWEAGRRILLENKIKRWFFWDILRVWYTKQRLEKVSKISQLPCVACLGLYECNLCYFGKAGSEPFCAVSRKILTLGEKWTITPPLMLLIYRENSWVLGHSIFEPNPVGALDRILLRWGSLASTGWATWTI